MNPPKRDLALLIDGDNINPNSLYKIVQFCEISGKLKIKKAYGDWTQQPLSSHRQKIVEMGLEPVQQDRIGKNATDFGLAMDVALMLEKAEANVYFIVSSDSDFTAVYTHIRKKGAQVIGIGDKSTAPKPLQDSCNQFIDIAELSTPKVSVTSIRNITASPKSPVVAKVNSSQQTTKPAASILTKSSKSLPKTSPLINQKVNKTATQNSTQKQLTKTTSPTKDKLTQTTPKLSKSAKTKLRLELMIQACQKSAQKDGWISLSEIGEVLREIDTKYKERFAKKKLSTWFKTFPNKFHVEKDRVRMK